ncbi:hypothetical protein C8R41DRAFT_870995 [Lentinula lateritia]|uniref:GIY-YIG domain-containing protein n=1 Tax=Lentinula lateritia TaxID=40482 RepID=A0ABQ8V1J6_9AGAR|nr:hypothetical protein C8R41DRAFT_870995 [Lentinula lateritia]
MTRRPTYRLQKLYTRQRLRLVSPSDGRGWLYAYLDGGIEWKIGMSKDFVRRRRDWEKRCPCRNRKWFPPVPVANRRRAANQVTECTLRSLPSLAIGGSYGEKSLKQHCKGRQPFEEHYHTSHFSNINECSIWQHIGASVGI